ncbi:hypothetical protein [Carboxylicivirga marina]|uniref:Uncharacterized protein n=1 Tax=Carboxylicivirga marina TaxID=2800988 RepID=A0ABS1HP71_9BACT|nr:hypothetical protein [Carboxylicivirga marina]MBK3519477.1 hypothetical protein [Carboxylicivirga marina]
MNLSIDEIIDTSNLIISDIKVCKTAQNMELIKQRIEIFKEVFMSKAKHKADEGLVETYYNLLIELADYARMKMDFESQLS